MNASLNLLIGWLWILLGFAAGMVLGLFFHQENWLGGYASFKRRMYRLAHISFFGLGTINLLFGLTARSWLVPGQLATAASISFVVGALTMPLCCILLPRFPKAQSLFAVPVTSLIAGGVLMLIQLTKL